jgi:DNA-binding MarR family transcriptional regulator
MARRRSPQAAAPRGSAHKKNGAPPARKRAAEPALAHLCFAIGRAYYNYLGVLECVLAETGLDTLTRPGMGPILFALFERDDQAIKELVERLEGSHSTLSGMLRRMKRAGLIELCRDAADGRSVRVRLTPLGKSLEPRCHVALGKIHNIMLGEVSEAQMRATQQTLKRMTESMRNYDRQQRFNRAG